MKRNTFYPVCYVALYVDLECMGISQLRIKNGKHYKDYFYYGCKHRRRLQGYLCTFNKQLQEEKLDNAVAEIISKLVSSPKFAVMMQKNQYEG